MVRDLVHSDSEQVAVFLRQKPLLALAERVLLVFLTPIVHILQRLGFLTELRPADVHSQLLKGVRELLGPMPEPCWLGIQDRESEQPSGDVGRPFREDLEVNVTIYLLIIYSYV